MFPNALLADQETQDDSEIYSVAEAKRKLSAELGRYRDGQLGVSVEADISGGNSDTSASKTQIGRDAGVAQFLELYRWFASSNDYQETLRHLTDAAFLSMRSRAFPMRWQTHYMEKS